MYFRPGVCCRLYALTFTFVRVMRASYAQSTDVSFVLGEERTLDELMCRLLGEERTLDELMCRSY